MFVASAGGTVPLRVSAAALPLPSMWAGWEGRGRHTVM